MDILKSSSGKLFWSHTCLSEDAICDFRKALLEAVSCGIGDGDGFYVVDEGDGYRCEMDRPDGDGGEVSWTRLDNDGVMAFVRATRKLHFRFDSGLNEKEIGNWLKRNALDENLTDMIFSMPALNFHNAEGMESGRSDLAAG